MNEGIVLLNHGKLWPIGVGALLLWAVFLWKEWPQRREARGQIKALVSLLGMAALALMALRPALPLKSAGGKGILVTQGHRPEQLDSLRTRYGQIPVESYVGGQALGPLDRVDSLFILGAGPEAFDHWQLKDKAINFLGGPKPSGLVDIAHSQKIYLGETLRVRAEFHDPAPGHWAYLRGPGGNPLDSVALKAGEKRQIELGARPKAEGLFVHTLEVRDQKGNPVATEPIPVEVQGPKAMDILMLERFPSFEGKYLKNFLAQRGHRLTVRSQLSRDRYKFEAINGGKARFQGFGREGLENFDLILMDTGSYLGLGRSERTALENALKENAGGLLILPEGPLFTGGSTPFRFQREGSTVFDLAPGSPGLEKYPYAFGQGFPLQAITVEGATVAAYLPLESGRVATTLVRDSYQLILKGEGERYAALWTRIVDAMVPGKGAWAQWEALTPLPRVDAPFGFKIWTPMGDPLVKSGDGAQIPLIQDLAAPELWQGRLYPKKTGWNTLELPGDSLSLYSLYVFDSGQRTAMGLSGRLEANTARFARAGSFGPMGETQEKRPMPLSPLWFFVPWLLAMGWLWLEPRLWGG